MRPKLKLKKGDRVVVITGRDKGQTGHVLKVYPKDNFVLVEGVTVVNRHQAQTANQRGGIITKDAPLDVSNVAHVDPKEGKPTRIGYKNLKDGRKVRFAKRSGEVIDV